MTNSTATRDDRSNGQRPRTAAPHPMPPPKLRRRPGLVAGAVAAVAIGAAMTAWAWTSATNTREVLAASDTIHRGEVIDADDLTRTRISGGQDLQTITADETDAIVGKRAALDIAAGSLLTPESATEETIPAEGQSIVGISLTGAQAPAMAFRAGDRVRIVVTPAEGSEASGIPASTEAEVASSRFDEVANATVVNVVVAREDAAVLAARAASGNVALILDSGEG